MTFQKVEQPGFVRDLNSRAVSVTDDSARDEHRHRIRTKRELDELRKRVVELEECCQNSRIEIESKKCYNSKIFLFFENSVHRKVVKTSF